MLYNLDFNFPKVDLKEEQTETGLHLLDSILGQSVDFEQDAQVSMEMTYQMENQTPG